MRVPVSLLPFGTRASDLTHAQALQSPCLTCAETPCCSYLPVHRFAVNHLSDLDYATYLLNFTGIELAISPDAEWSVYYRQSCRHLSPVDGSCTLHGTVEQPLVCQHYNPYQCWYKRVLTAPVSAESIRIDRARLEWIVQRVGYDENRRVLRSPTWHEMISAFADLPLEVTPARRPAAGAPPADPAARAGTALTIRALSNGPRKYADLTARSPCDGCAAYCCTRVEFPLAVPETVASLDFAKFSLGFPGVQIGVADAGWRLIITTSCRHLQDGRCSVIGTSTRPLRCSYYDAWRCTFKTDYGASHSEALLTIALGQYDWLLETIDLDADGTVIAMPAAADIAAYIRARSTAAVDLAGTGTP